MKIQKIISQVRTNNKSKQLFIVQIKVLPTILNKFRIICFEAANGTIRTLKSNNNASDIYLTNLSLYESVLAS